LLYVFNDGKPVFKEVKELIDGELYIIPGQQPMPTKSVRLRLVVTAHSWGLSARLFWRRKFSFVSHKPSPCSPRDSIPPFPRKSPLDSYEGQLVFADHRPLSFDWGAASAEE
jgi:hypothetical protein